MLLLDYKKQFNTALKKEYPKGEINSFFNILIAHYLNISRLELALDPKKELSPEEKNIFDKILLRLQQHEPIQYILGETEFFGLKFQVDKNVLIPRPETEELVSWILSDLSENKTPALKIIDIGTGSGCIAISLAKNLPEAKLTALDIFKDALKVATRNAEANNVKLNFLNQNILNIKDPLGPFDIIVSNPPYVRELEKKQMHRNVLENEPDVALYVRDKDPLVFYEAITKLAQVSLNKGGSLYFEINQYLAEETEQMMKKAGFKTCLKKDIFGNFRMIRGIKQ
ncbi:release factor glutamine methyltransferase [Gillisia sp. Hel_I_86]|uniref:peptide chain release factor N(5)-glutamine methyltransferase n=1 Tax=Gillisia sp. Hel_I_86 TaxID=1249981 RepID=UPI0011996D97|nr:peptide chain release factor N(5)-glutamine methyltransferase [Gillisia sp. Hel_I_86]TVZ25372.1 release factor glutamine methyltransferase [Gillisia sp. Hel_I_86]